MRASLALLALPALSLAAEQVPIVDRLKGWFNQATSSIQSAASAIPNPVDAGAAKVAEITVVPINDSNWRETLVPSSTRSLDTPEEWLILITGSNKTCIGGCEIAEKAFNQSAALLSSGANAPKLGVINCERDPIICNRWAFIVTPGIVHVLLPKPSPDQSLAYAPEVRMVPLNRTSVTASDITELSASSKSKYEEQKPYEGWFHPWTGFINTSPVGKYIAIAIYWISKIPSFAFMILISFASRHFMRRMPGQGGFGPKQDAPAPNAAAAKKSK